MRIFMSVDIEGVCDVVNKEHTGNSGFLYNSAREQMTKEANAAIEGAIKAGATEIVVNDSHGPMVNLMPGLLHKQAELITGTTKPQGMMQGVDDSFDAVMFVGYHSRNNTPGVLSHTISGGSVDNIWINDTVVGEIGFNAAFAGAYDLPVILVTGDNVATAEARELLGEDLTTAQVKKAVTRYSAQCLHPETACERIKEAAFNAVTNYKSRKPYKPEAPYVGKIQFHNSGLADGAARLPGSTRVSGDTVSYQSDCLIDLLNALRVLISLSR